MHSTKCNLLLEWRRLKTRPGQRSHRHALHISTAHMSRKADHTKCTARNSSGWMGFTSNHVTTTTRSRPGEAQLEAWSQITSIGALVCMPMHLCLGSGGNRPKWGCTNNNSFLELEISVFVPYIRWLYRDVPLHGHCITQYFDRQAPFFNLLDGFMGLHYLCI